MNQDHTDIQTYRHKKCEKQIDYKKIERMKKNKDDNIHKSEALKQYNRRTLTLVECQN